MKAISLPLILLAALLTIPLTLTGCSPVGLTVRLGAVNDQMVASPVLEIGEGQGKPRDRVAMIVVRGLITDTPSQGLLGDSNAPIDDMVRQLKLAGDDESVKALIIRIDSPGGTVAGSATAYREVRAFAEKTGKPVVISMGEVATSGGYYLALAGDHIVAEPGTLTGSIGVLIPSFNVSEGLGKLGIHTRFLTSGPNKDLANPVAPMREEHYDILQGIVREYYASFLSVVLRRRPGLLPEHVAQATDGRVMTGDTAAAIGLVDSVGGIREAADKAMELASIEHAVLVRYGSRANAPRTAYATGTAPQPLMADQSVSLFRLEGGGLAPGALGLRPGVGYYVWVP
ncbi:MAG: signal peptide peptidase SppA [Phycisphaerales bacterium JB064]